MFGLLFIAYHEQYVTLLWFFTLFTSPNSDIDFTGCPFPYSEFLSHWTRSCQKRFAQIVSTSNAVFEQALNDLPKFKTMLCDYDLNIGENELVSISKRNLGGIVLRSMRMHSTVCDYVSVERLYFESTHVVVPRGHYRKSPPIILEYNTGNII